MNHQIIDYLNHHKDNFSQEDLVNQLRDSGYQDSDIKKGVGVVYGEKNYENPVLGKNKTRIIILAIAIFVVVSTVGVLAFLFVKEKSSFEQDDNGMSSIIEAMSDRIERGDESDYTIEETSPNMFKISNKNANNSEIKKDIDDACPDLVQVLRFYGDIVNVEGRSDEEIIEGITKDSNFSKGETCVSRIAFIKTMYSYDLDCSKVNKCDSLIKKTVDNYIDDIKNSKAVFEEAKRMSREYYDNQILFTFYYMDGSYILDLIEEGCYISKPENGALMCENSDGSYKQSSWRWLDLSETSFEHGGCDFYVDRSGNEVKFQFCMKNIVNGEVIKCSHEKCGDPKFE